MSKNRLFCLTTLSLLSLSVTADGMPDVYGKLNLSRDFVEDGNDNWVSNVSRVGLKGSTDVSEQLAIIYQIEQEVDVLHGGFDVDTLFGMRNTFVGLQGTLGTVMFGAYDTPLKRAQGKIDQFNDQAGDIKVLLPGEVRPRDSYVWHSPVLVDRLTVEAMYVPKDSVFDASQSISFGWQQDNLTLTFGIDHDMRKNERAAASTNVYNSYRGVAAYSIANWELGLLLQSSELAGVANSSTETGYIVSAARALGDLTLKGQWGQSDILVPGARQLLLGADYQVAKNTTVYGLMSSLDQGNGSDLTLSFGVDVRF